MAIVFTDGFDTISFLDEAAVLEIARRSHMAVFLVATTQFGEKVPEPFFSRLAELTGGLAQIIPPYTVVNTGRSTRLTFGPPDDMLDAPFLRALQDFRTSYVVRYTPEGVPRTGWHQLAVRVTKGGGPYSVRTRDGYMGAR